MVAKDRDVDLYFQYCVDFLRRTAWDFINDSKQIQVMARIGLKALEVCFELAQTLPKTLLSRPTSRAYLEGLVRSLLGFAYKAEDKASNTRESREVLLAILEDAEEAFVQFSLYT